MPLRSILLHTAVALLASAALVSVSSRAGWFRASAGVATSQEPRQAGPPTSLPSPLVGPTRVQPPPNPHTRQQLKVNCSVLQTGAPTRELWWFGGADAQEYSERVTLTAVDGLLPVQPPIEWTVVKGRDKVAFPNGLDTIVTLGTSVDLLSTAASAPAATITKDVEIRVRSANGNTCHYPLVVFAPGPLLTLSEVHVPGPDGYTSQTFLRSETQFAMVLPAFTELNADWGPDVSDFPGENWPWRMERAAFVSPAVWADVTDRDAMGIFTVPPAQGPQNPLGTTRVDHRDGALKHGSVTTNVGPDNNPGLVVKSLRWQNYQDHASHE